MKIAIDLRSLQSGQITGVENYTFNLVNHLLSLDRKNSYVFFYNSWAKKNVPDLNFINSQARAVKLPNRILNFALKAGVLTLEKLVGEVDCFFLPNLNQFHLGSKTKLVITVHDLSPTIFPEFYDLKRRFWHKYLGYARAYQRADLIFAVSEYTKLDLVRLFKIDSQKIRVIHPGLDHNFFKPQPVEKKRRLRNIYGLPGDFIFFLNTVEPRKNLSNLIKAFEHLKSPAFLVVAGKKGWKHNKIFKAIKRSSKRQKIIYLGYIKEEDKPGLISLAKALVYPSFYEGFGFQPLESFAVGTPVVVSQTASLPEVVKNAAVLANPYSSQDLARAIDLVLSDEALRGELIKKGFIRAKDFDWSFTAARVLKELNFLTDKNNA